MFYHSSIKYTTKEKNIGGLGSKKQIVNLSWWLRQKKGPDRPFFQLQLVNCYVMTSCQAPWQKCFWCDGVFLIRRYRERVPCMQQFAVVGHSVIRVSGNLSSHPTGQWFRRQFCCLKSRITMILCLIVHSQIAEPSSSCRNLFPYTFEYL